MPRTGSRCANHLLVRPLPEAVDAECALGEVGRQVAQGCRLLPRHTRRAHHLVVEREHLLGLGEEAVDGVFRGRAVAKQPNKAPQDGARRLAAELLEDDRARQRLEGRGRRLPDSRRPHRLDDRCHDGIGLPQVRQRPFRIDRRRHGEEGSGCAGGRRAFDTPLVGDHDAPRYALFVIRSFRDRDAERLYDRQPVRRWSPGLQRAALRKLRMLASAETLDDLRVPPGNRLERLRGDRSGQFSIRINEQWRICFRWEAGHASEVEIVDYHA